VPAGYQRLSMSILDDVDEIAALYGNSEAMRFIAGGVLALPGCRHQGSLPVPVARNLLITNNFCLRPRMQSR
jgi:hypothetical protein